jgi:aminopeptidase N
MSSSYAQAGMAQFWTTASSSNQQYTDWELGERQRYAYQLKSQLAWREGEVEKLAIDAEKYKANVQAVQAAAAKRDAEAMAAAGRMRAESFQEETDTKAAQLYAGAAKFGVMTNGGSTLELLNSFASKRARSLAELKWQTGQQVYGKNIDAYTKEAQAAITLYDAKVREGNLPMYAYQGGLYMMAGEQAKKDATTRIIADQIAELAKSSEIWSNAAGGGGGGGGGMGNMTFNFQGGGGAGAGAGP